MKVNIDLFLRKMKEIHVFFNDQFVSTDRMQIHNER